MFARTALPVLLVALVAGCQRPAGSKADSTTAATPPAAQELKLEIDGQPVTLPLESFDVYLTEEDEYPETFEFRGPAVVLVGTFPRDVRVDYGEHWDVLVGKPIEILPAGDNEDLVSSLTPPGGMPLQVLGGSFTVEKIGTDTEGNTPLSGRIELKVQAPDGEKTIPGTFSVNGSTLG
jgi:hypothetical protein